MSKIISMKDINKSRSELRDKQIQTRGYVSRFEPLALRPRLHLERFSLSPQKNSTKETLSTYEEGTKPMILYTRGGHKAKTPLHKRDAQSKRKLQHLVITKITNKKFHNNKILKRIDTEMIVHPYEKTKVLEVKLLRHLRELL